MDLYIRSQDKKVLVKTDYAYLVRENKYYHIYCSTNDNLIDLGQYGDFEDKTRALEVLDEIQKFIERGCKEYKSNGDYYTSKYEYSVFQMPQD